MERDRLLKSVLNPSGKTKQTTPSATGQLTVLA